MHWGILLDATSDEGQTHICPGNRMRRPQSFYLFSLHAADKTRPKMDPNVPQETPVDVREMRESNIVEYQGSFLNPFGGHLWFTMRIRTTRDR